MSDIIIRGMDMPPDCDKCPFFDDNYDYPFCNVTQHSRGYNWNPRGQRMPECPLIEVKTPHGRLIDAEDLKANHINDVLSGWDTKAGFSCDVIRSMPTILLASSTKICNNCSHFDNNDCIHCYGTCELQDKDFHISHECNLNNKYEGKHGKSS